MITQNLEYQTLTKKFRILVEIKNKRIIVKTLDLHKCCDFTGKSLDFICVKEFQ